MFSVREKQFLAAEIEKLILGLKHPEMPTEKPKFHLRVDGKEDWSWAEIDPNWTFNKDNPPGVNLFNEVAREILEDKPQKEEDDDPATSVFGIGGIGGGFGGFGGGASGGAGAGRGF